MIVDMEIDKKRKDSHMNMDEDIYMDHLEQQNFPSPVRFFNGMQVGQEEFITFILGPSRMESYDHALYLADAINDICWNIGIGSRWIFASPIQSPILDGEGGLGLHEGIRVLQEIKNTFGIPVSTDAYETYQYDFVSEVADMIGIPAVLCEYPGLLITASNAKNVVNVKKGRSVSPEKVRSIIRTLRESQRTLPIVLTEQGSWFGYNDCLVDMRSLAILRQYGEPICFDAPCLEGQQGFIPVLVRAAVAAGVDIISLTVHDELHGDPNTTSQLSLTCLENILQQVLKIRSVCQNFLLT